MWPAVSLVIALSQSVFALPPDNLGSPYTRRDTTPTQIKEPPGAAHALRDPSKLKYEIAGIIGSYVLWLIATVVLIVFVGNRLRRKAQTSDHNLDMTMMKTIHTSHRTIEIPKNMNESSLQSPGLKSPARLPSLGSWRKKGHKTNPSAYSVSTMHSVQSVAHDEHKAKDMDDLTKLYAAVMAHDEERSQGRNSAAQSPVSPTATSPQSPKSPGYPPEFAHLHNANLDSQALRSPQFSQTLQHPLAPTPTGETFPQENRSYYDPNIPSRNSSRTNKTTPLSFVSDTSSRAGTVISTRSRPSRISVRGHNISQPIGSADLSNAQYYDETVPLSPRVYAPGPPPPTPGKKKQVQVTVEPVEERSPPRRQHPSYEQHYPQEHGQPQQYNEPQHHQQYQPYQYNEQQQIPIQLQSQAYQPQPDQQQLYPIQYQEQPQPQLLPLQRSPPKPTNPLAQNLRDKRVPPSLALRSAALNNATASASTAHPANAPQKTMLFRDMYGDHSLRSAPPTKTTFLDRPTKLPNAPKTGVVPSTPYSPYMPNTPMTPITPRRLMTKQELKAKRKEEKLKVLTEDDLVNDEDDVWGK